MISSKLDINIGDKYIRSEDSGIGVVVKTNDMEDYMCVFPDSADMYFSTFDHGLIEVTTPKGSTYQIMRAHLGKYKLHIISDTVNGYVSGRFSEPSECCEYIYKETKGQEGEFTIEYKLEEESCCGPCEATTPECSPTKGSSVLLQVQEERRRQEDMWGADFDSRNTINDWISYICSYATTGRNDEAAFRTDMIKVAALAVAAVEAYDRSGGYPPRHYDVECNSKCCEAPDCNSGCTSYNDTVDKIYWA
jgi:hypothetical protein